MSVRSHAGKDEDGLEERWAYRRHPGVDEPEQGQPRQGPRRESHPPVEMVHIRRPEPPAHRRTAKSRLRQRSQGTLVSPSPIHNSGVTAFGKVGRKVWSQSSSPPGTGPSVPSVRLGTQVRRQSASGGCGRRAGWAPRDGRRTSRAGPGGIGGAFPRRDRCPRPSSYTDPQTDAMGRRIENSVPWPTAEVTSTVPRWASVNSFTMARPMPVPGRRFACPPTR